MSVIMARMRQRWVAVVVIASTVVAAVTCVRDDLVECNGIACPAGFRCVSDPALPEMTCASPEQGSACEGRAPGSACDLAGRPGTCFDDACIVAVCGDRIVDANEACDDGNTTGSDGCSANCLSNEKCGDGVVDLAANEQCDDGVRGISGDGCSSQCKVEYLFWRDVTPAQIATRFGVAFTTSPTGNVLLYGGAVGTGSNHNASYDETWEWDGSTWAKVSPPITPPRRTLMSFAYDERRNVVVMFGGFDSAGVRTDTTWEYDGVRWIERTPAVRPSPRASASFACSPTTCVLFGGDTGSVGSAADAETWSWDGATWTQMQGAGPPGRLDAGLAYDTANGVFILAGGHHQSGSARIDTWELSADHWIEKTGTQLPATPTTVSAAYEKTESAIYANAASSIHEYGATGWVATTSVVGQNLLAWNEKRRRLNALSYSQINSVFEFDGTTWAATTHSRPSGTTHAHVTYAPASGRTILFERLTGTWAWDGSAWRLLAPPASPSPNVTGSAMVFDETCDDVLLFGGLLPGGVSSSETWTFDGAWTKLPIAGPPARVLHSMVYDPIRHATFLVGGRASVSITDTLEDMWQLAGPCNTRVWTRVDATPLPPGRVNSAFAFDVEHGVAMLFGGQSEGLGGPPLGDTWTWDGSAWTEHATSPSPPARFDHALAFDPRRRELVLAGGRSNPVARFDDVWRWNGSSWIETPALVSPEARAGAALAPDRTGGLVFIGGDTASNALNMTQQVARLSYDQALHANERCQLADADADRDGFVGCDDPDCRWRCAPSCPITIELANCTGPRCGDGECSAIEDLAICPADCP